MPERDNFSTKVRNAVALRSNYLCAFEGCGQLTAGPSDESPLAVAHVGFAAHIHAAAPGGKRYLASMTPEERSDIGNAIWMCPTHATLIDQDEVTYPADRLRAMKASHEEAVRRLVAAKQPPSSLVSTATPAELLALGPNVVCLGELIRMDEPRWEFRIDHFVTGDCSVLTDYASGFDELGQSDRFLLVNELGDGRVLKRRPSWWKSDGKFIVEVEVAPRFPRKRAEDLGTDIAFDTDFKRGPSGDLATVSGIDAVAQKVRLCLWHQKGQLLWDTEFGTRIAEYYHLFSHSPWLEPLIKLEAVRFAAIPHYDELLRKEYTPFQCVERVRSVSLTGEREGEWVPAHIDLEVRGVGPWSMDLPLYVPEYPFPSGQKVLDDMVRSARLGP